MKEKQLNELLYQALETELGGVQIYTTAGRCAENEDLKEEWEKYLEQTRNHVRIVQETMETMGLDPKVETPGRKVVRHIGESLVKAMEMALESGEPGAAQLVACEAVSLAETQGSFELAFDWRGREETNRGKRQGSEGRSRRGRGRRGRASLSHKRLDQRALDRISGHEGCTAAAGGS
jgi:hypothetical protein